MPDLTRDEWDDMQEGYKPEPLQFECSCCGMMDFPENLVLDEGDMWECFLCNIRLDAKEYYKQCKRVDECLCDSCLYFGWKYARPDRR